MCLGLAAVSSLHDVITIPFIGWVTAAMSGMTTIVTWNVALLCRRFIEMEQNGAKRGMEQSAIREQSNSGHISLSNIWPYIV